MQQVGKFSLTIAGNRGRIFRGSREIVVEVLIDKESTHVVIDCTACKDLLKNQLPRGEMIAVVSGMKKFFDAQELKKIKVSVSGGTMHREYAGVVEESHIDDLRECVEQSLDTFTHKHH
ncbi:MAG: hypothetical protein K9W43_03935 [Candidatus Thorarchaeota archaeon]|nr:hypothetical protein [Candidatus Thorarchaeota archaeon]